MTIFTSVAFVDVVIAILLLETAIVCMIARRTRRGRWHGCVPGNLAGVFLLLALRFALQDTTSALIIAALAGALLAHAVDVHLRIRFSDRTSVQSY